MFKTPITPNDFTPALGSYSHAMKVDVGDSEMIFMTAQMPMDKEGNVVSEDIEEQTEFVFNNINILLDEAGASIDDVVKVQIFLTDVSEFKKVSPIRNKYFEKSKPVSTLIEIKGLPKAGCRVAIEVMAIRKK